MFVALSWDQASVACLCCVSGPSCSCVLRMPACTSVPLCSMTRMFSYLLHVCLSSGGAHHNMLCDAGPCIHALADECFLSSLEMALVATMRFCFEVWRCQMNRCWQNRLICQGISTAACHACRVRQARQTYDWRPGRCERSGPKSDGRFKSYVSDSHRH